MISDRMSIPFGLGLLMLVTIGTESFAAEVHKSDDFTVSIGGNIQLMVIGQNEVDVADNGSRLHFDFSGPIAGSVRGRGHFEWYVNTTAGREAKPYQYRGSNSVGLSNNGGDILTNRLGYFELGGDSFGSFTIGKQNSVYLQTTEVTDIFNVYSAMTSATYVYGDGGLSGTGRIDNAIVWTKGYRAGSGTLTLGLQAQIIESTITVCTGSEDDGECTPGEDDYVGMLEGKGGEGIRLAYDTDSGLGIGASYVRNNLSGEFAAGQEGNLVDPAAGALALSFDGDHLYAAATGSVSDQMYQDDLGTPMNGWGLELALGYNISPGSDSGSFMPFVGWNHMATDDPNYLGEFGMDYLVFGVNWNAPQERFFAFVEAMIDQSTQADGSDSGEDYVSVGMYFRF
jgi:predicted porin